MRAVPGPGLLASVRGDPRPDGALLAGDWDVADSSTARQRRDAAGITSAYLQWHLERHLRSLPYVER